MRLRRRQSRLKVANGHADSPSDAHVYESSRSSLNHDPPDAANDVADPVRTEHFEEIRTGPTSKGCTGEMFGAKVGFNAHRLDLVSTGCTGAPLGAKGMIKPRQPTPTRTLPEMLAPPNKQGWLELGKSSRASFRSSWITRHFIIDSISGCFAYSAEEGKEKKVRVSSDHHETSAPCVSTSTVLCPSHTWCGTGHPF